jgi:hypothetical protein
VAGAQLDKRRAYIIGMSFWVGAAADFRFNRSRWS